MSSLTLIGGELWQLNSRGVVPGVPTRLLMLWLARGGTWQFWLFSNCAILLLTLKDIIGLNSVLLCPLMIYVILVGVRRRRTRCPRVLGGRAVTTDKHVACIVVLPLRPICMLFRLGWRVNLGRVAPSMTGHLTRLVTDIVRALSDMTYELYSRTLQYLSISRRLVPLIGIRDRRLRVVIVPLWTLRTIRCVRVVVILGSLGIDLWGALNYCEQVISAVSVSIVGLILRKTGIEFWFGSLRGFLMETMWWLRLLVTSIVTSGPADALVRSCKALWMF